MTSRSKQSAPFVFFNDTATTEIYTTANPLSLHDALPISEATRVGGQAIRIAKEVGDSARRRSEEHTSEPPVTRCYLVCRLLLEKKNKVNGSTVSPSNVIEYKKTELKSWI